MAGARPHGVPFTGAIGADALLSWGADPPSMRYAVPWRAQESWRSWLTKHLASYLLTGQDSAPSDDALCRFVVDRVALDGVDVSTWSPGSPVWGRSLSGASR